MQEEYFSVSALTRAEIVQKRSRFIGIVSPADSAKEAEERLAWARREFPDASHHCYAYLAGLDETVVRMSDDGEPEGTAGRPILEVLERHQLVNMCGVVIRYFGGTKLGAAGLTRAYRAAISAAVEKAGVSRFQKHLLAQASFSYADWARTRRLLQELGVHMEDVAYKDVVSVTFAVPAVEIDVIEEELAHATSGAAGLERLGHRYMAPS